LTPFVEEVSAALSAGVVIAALALEDVHAERHAEWAVVFVRARLLSLMKKVTRNGLALLIKGGDDKRYQLILSHPLQV
jgi:hypothetical protein